MATIYDFQTNYEKKITESAELMEKGYVDQAICLLEDFLEMIKDQRIKNEVQKQLITGYMLKEEFETCEELILEIKQNNGLDLVVAAHDILVAMFQVQNDLVEAKKNEYRQLLGLNALTNKNLIELIYQLKMYYENYWCEAIGNKLQCLKNEASFETKLMILSDLQQVNAVQLALFKEEIQSILNHCEMPIIKTMLFELLVQRGIEFLVDFENETLSRQLSTTKQNLEGFYQQVNSAISLISQTTLDEEICSLLKQHVIFFYQFIFPFAEEVEEGEVLEQLAQQLLGINLSLSHQQNQANHKLNTMTDITYKMSQYILSLSSLM